MIRLSQGVSWCHCDDATTPELEWLDDYLSCEVERYTPGGVGRRRVRDRYRMLSPATRSFPSGLLPLVISAARAENMQVEVADVRGPVRTPPDPGADVSWLRDYQLKAAQVMVRHGRGLVKAPTGSGKSELFIALTRLIPCEWLLVVHRADLVEQAAERYRLRTGETAGRWVKGAWVRGTANFTVATFQAIAAALKRKGASLEELLRDVEGLIVDEVHAQPAASFYKVTMAARNARHRFGFSATPLERSEKDTLRTIGSLGPIIHKISTQGLIARGVLSRPTIRMVACHAPAGLAQQRLDWHAAYKALITRAGARNRLVCEMALAAQKPCLVFVEEVDHGREVARELQAMGLHAQFVHGHDPLPVRRTKLGDLMKNRHDVLVCTVVFQEGVDMPQLASIVVATGKASSVATLQRLGRGMRTALGKSTFELWDVWDRGHPWTQKHAHARLAAYEREGHVVDVLPSLSDVDKPIRSRSKTA